MAEASEGGAGGGGASAEGGCGCSVRACVYGLLRGELDKCVPTQSTMVKSSLVIGATAGAVYFFMRSDYVLSRRGKRPRIVPFTPNTEGVKFEHAKRQVSPHFQSCARMISSNDSSTDLELVKPVYGTSEFRVSDIKKDEKLTRMNPNIVWLVKNVLSKEECEALMEASEQTGFVERKFVGDGKDSASCVVSSMKLADAIYARIKDCVPQMSYFDMTPGGLTLSDYEASQFAMDISYYGTRLCINPHIRVEKYGSKQYLKVHRDGCVLVKSDGASGDVIPPHVYTVYAVVIYLNDSFEGGFTGFCKDIKDPSPPPSLAERSSGSSASLSAGADDSDERDSTSDDSSSMDSSGRIKHIGMDTPYSFVNVRGQMGDALIFRHEVLHAGLPIYKGNKYILRMDVGYQVDFRISKGPMPAP